MIAVVMCPHLNKLIPIGSCADECNSYHDDNGDALFCEESNSPLPIMPAIYCKWSKHFHLISLCEQLCDHWQDNQCNYSE